MPSPKNKNQLSQLSNRLSSATGLVFTDPSGLSVSLQNKLRQQITQTDAEYSVAKNTLLQISLKKKLGKLPQAIKGSLSGPTAILITYQDLINSIKTLAQFIKENQLPQIKTGIDFSQKTNSSQLILDKNTITKLSLLPSRKELLNQLLSQLQAPTQNLVRTLNAPMQKLVYALTAIKKQKNKGGDT